MTLPVILGNLGVIALLVGYFMLQKGKYKQDSYMYLTLNLVGSLLLMLSLWWDWNLSAFVLEGIWAAVSIYGMAKRYRKERTA